MALRGSLTKPKHSGTAYQRHLLVDISELVQREPGQVSIA